MIQNKKRIISLILMLTLLVSSLVVGAITASAAGENVSDFSTENAGGTAYTTRTTAKGWVGVNCGKTTVGNETAFIMNGKTSAVGSITSPSLSGGVSSITFGYANTYSESNGVSVTITVTSSSGVQSTTLSKAKADVTQNKAYSHTWTLETPVTGDFTIKFTNNSPSNSTSNKDRVSIFNVTWVSYTSGGTTEPEVPVVTYDYSFNVPAGFIAPAGGNGNKVKLPEFTGNLADGYEKYTFEGWVVGEFTEDSEILPSGEEYELSNDTVFSAVFSYAGSETTQAYLLKDISTIGASDIVVIVINNNNGYYAMSNNNGASSAPTATKVTIENGQIIGDVADTIKWNITNVNGSLTIHPNGDTTKWLYCTSANNGVRVGTNTASAFSIDANSGYLKHTGTSRFVGVYNNADWRCYTTVNSNITGQTLGFYVYSDIATTEYTTTLEKSVCECEYGYTSLGNNMHKVTCLNGCGYEVIEGCFGGTATCTSLATCDACGVTYGNKNTANHSSTSTYVTGVIEANCTTPGYTGDTYHSCCDAIKEKGEITYADHNYVNNICSVCGKVDPLSVDYSGRFFIAAIRTEGNYFYMTSNLGQASTKRYQAVDSGLTELTATICPKDGYVFVLVKNGDGTYKIYAEGVEGDNYLGWSSGNSGILVAEDKAISFTVDLLESGKYNIHFAAGDEERYLSLNGTTNNNYFAFYTGTQKQDLSLIPVEHNYADATCTAPKTCACGATEGEALGHSWSNATCTAPKTCGTCGATEGEALGHTWDDATCTAPKTCSVCGATEGDALGHSYNSVVTNPTFDAEGYTTYTCSVCNHSYVSNTVPALVAVAKIGDARFETLQAALDAAQTGDVITLVAHVQASKYLDVKTANNGEVARNFTLDLNGHTISPAEGYNYNSGYSLIFVGINQTLTIKGEGTITADKKVTVGVYGVLNLVGGTIINKGTSDEDAALCIWHWDPAVDGDDYGHVVSGTGVVTGGTIKGDVYCEEGGAKLTVNVNENITLDQALAIGGTITLTKDVNYGAADFIIPSAVTINLNGHNITAAGVITFDPATRFVGAGKLVIPQDKIVLSGEADDIAVWVGDGYVFNQVKDQYKSEVTGDDSFNVVFRPSFGSTEHNKEILGGEINAGLTFELQIWNGETKLFAGTIKADLIKQAYKNGGAISIRVKNAPAGTYTVKLVIKSSIGLINTAEFETITIPAVEDAPAEAN